MQKTLNQTKLTTIERMENAVSQLIECGYSRTEAIDRLIYDFEVSGNSFLTEYAKKNLLA